MNISVSSEDPHTSANPDLARVTYVDLELIVDFDRKVLKGKALMTIEREPLTNEIILDINGLVISRVKSIPDQTHLNFYFGTEHILGSSLHVLLPVADDIYESKCKIKIEYETSPDSPALNWLTPAQTADGKHPFLLSDNQLTNARAMFPCQDTPSVKFTYTTTISVPKEFTVLMSASRRSMHEINTNTIYQFYQSKPIPSYAVTIAVGVLKNKNINEKSSIFAEKKFLDESAYMFAFNTIGNMLTIAEGICGSYRWDRFDICVLPPSIAHLEIKCPCLIFVSPTLLGGDTDCISSLAELIAPCWAGHSVTCCNYENLWLNKSFSTFISRKIMCKMSVNKEMQCLLRRKGLHDLANVIRKLGNTDLLKCLLPNLTHLSPNETVKYVLYERGCMLLYHLESILGGSSKFDLFLICYFNEFAYKSINTKDWINYLYQHFVDNIEILDSVEWETYFYATDFPIVMPAMTKWELSCSELINTWETWNEAEHIVPPSLMIGSMIISDNEKIILLNTLYYSNICLRREKLKILLRHCNLENQNGEIRYLWLLLCIKNRWVKKVKLALEFAIEFRSLHIACRIFEALYDWVEMREETIRAYSDNKEKMLNETQKKLQLILHINEYCLFKN